MAKDLTKGSPIRLIFFFALPLLLGNAFQQIYNTVDTLIVGRAIGVKALAGVGCTGSVLFLIIGFMMGMASGFSIVCAQRYGAGDMLGLRRSFCTSLILGTAIASLFTLVGITAAKPLLRLMNTPPDIFEYAHTYLVIIMSGIGATLFYNILSTTIMAMGDSRTPLFFLAMSCVLNITLDLVFIFCFGMGVGGAALATVLSQGVSGVLCFTYIFKKLYVLRPSKDDWRNVSFALFKRHLRMGIPMGFQTSVIALGIMIIQVALNGLGSTYVAAFTASMRIDMIGIMPLMSFGLAMATYTGQNFGAGRIDRIRLGVRHCYILSLSYAAFAAFICIVAGAPLVKIFVGDGQDEVVALGRDYLIIHSVMYWALALLFIYRNALQGMGNSFITTVAGITELIMRIFAAFVLVTGFGFLGVSVASPLAWMGALIPLAAAYFLWLRKVSKEVKIADGVDNPT